MSTAAFATGSTAEAAVGAAPFPYRLTVSLPLPSYRLANAAKRSIEVDSELSPSVCRRVSLASITREGKMAASISSGSHEKSLPDAIKEDEPTLLITEYSAATNRMLRVAVNGFMESMGVVLGVMAELDVDVMELGAESGSYPFEKPVPHAATAITYATQAPHVPEATVPGLKWEEVGPGGMRALWTITILMGIASLVFYLIASKVTVQKRLPVLLVSLITTTSFFAYYAMATGDGVGYSFRQVRHTHNKLPDTIEGIYRATYWPRWVNWTIASNISLFILTLISGLNGAGLLVLLSANTFMYIAAIFGAFGQHPEYKWGWFVIALFCYMVVFYQMFVKGRNAVMEKDEKTRRFFALTGTLYFLTSLAYPIVFGLGSYGHIISVNSEVITDAILDFLAQGLFAFVLLGGQDTIPAMLVPDYTSDSLFDNGGDELDDGGYADQTGCLGGFWAEGTNIDGSICIEDEDEEERNDGRPWQKDNVLDGEPLVGLDILLMVMATVSTNWYA
ncbi:hypothetical protein KEM54_006064 [Ascosphaera aggregata]|nr:hypothetical protein KEM54_006064 [Ascosphaera aggregata]